MALTCSAVAVAMVVGLVIAAPQARAGEWMQVSCVNPNGSAAPSDGWSSFTTGVPEVASNSNIRCTPRAPMTASLSDLGPAPVGTAYAVTARVDGATVWSGTPNTNGGHCVPVGSDPGSGALMFDWQQPCLPTEVVDAPVPTGGLHDGRHELSVSVTDAAQNTSTVLDQTITTSNPTLTPVPRSRRAVHARFLISWRWRGLRTTVRAISVRRLPRGARIAVRCRGRGCPTLRPRAARAGSVPRLLGALQGRRFYAGDRLLITVTAPRRRPERIEILIRNDKLPSARLLY